MSYEQENVGGVAPHIVQNSTYTYAEDAEVSDAYAITLLSAPVAYQAGQQFKFKANTANTGACSLNVNGLGAVTIKKNNDQDTVTGDIEAGSIVTVVHDGTNFQMLSADANLTGAEIAFTPAGGLASTDIQSAISELDTEKQTKPAEGAFADGDKTKLDTIESGATADQSDAEIETAYNNQVSTVSQAEAEAGTATTVRRWTAERVAQAIASQASGGDATFGDGSDGDVTISTNTTLVADMYYNNLTVNVGVVLNTGGYRIYVADTLINNGTISNNGSDGANGTNAVSIASGGTGGAGGAGGLGGTLTAGANGGAGGDGSDSGGSATAGTNGGNANPALAGNGSAGATGTSTSCTAGTAGTAGTATGETVKAITGTLQTVNLTAGSPSTFAKVLAFYASTSEFALSASAGSGGGGGSCHFDTGNRSCGGSGGGGGGGGIVWIVAKTLTNNGTISANGGNGGSGGSAINGGNAGVSGGKGSGGVVLLGYEAITVGTIQANAGASGAGAGVAGSIFRVQLSSTIA